MNTNFKVIDLTRLEIKPSVYRSRSRRSIHPAIGLVLHRPCCQSKVHAPDQFRGEWGGCIPPIIYRTLLFLMIYLADSMASRFLLWLQIATAFFLFMHLINKGQPSLVGIAEKRMKLCFLYAAEQRCSKKNRDERW